MTRADLIKQFRTVTQDKVEPYLFETSQVAQWLAEAEAEAAIRGRLLHESENQAVCEIDVTAGTSVYPLHESLFELTHVAFLPAGAARREQVKLASTEELDRIYPGWRDMTGQPVFAVQGDESIRLVPRPAAPGTLLLEGYRTPLTSLASANAVRPEINQAHHIHLVDWAVYLARSTPGAVMLDLGEAAEKERAFTGYFGIRPDSDMRRSTRTDEAQTNKAIWI